MSIIWSGEDTFAEREATDSALDISAIALPRGNDPPHLIFTIIERTAAGEHRAMFVATVEQSEALARQILDSCQLLKLGLDPTAAEALP